MEKQKHLSKMLDEESQPRPADAAPLQLPHPHHAAVPKPAEPVGLGRLDRLGDGRLVFAPVDDDRFVRKLEIADTIADSVANSVTDPVADPTKATVRCGCGTDTSPGGATGPGGATYLY